MTAKEPRDIAIVPEDHSADPVALISPKVLKSQMAVELQKRKLITDFITKSMKRGLDYGPIHVVSSCKDYGCSNPNHMSKDVLFKPGGEKFMSLFKLRAEFSRDLETWEMLGGAKGLVAYICRLYTANGVLVGEGRGACTVDEKMGKANTAIKIAQKRAKLDAILATGGLSDFFTQDLDEDDVPQAKRAKLPPADKAPVSGKSGKMSAAQAVEDILKKVKSSKNADGLIEIDERVQESKLYSKEQKDAIHAAISKRVEEIDAVIR